jgi:acyl dehydratase
MAYTPLRFTQAEFDRFGRLSGDLNPIHVDPDFSAQTRFGTTVAHGMMLFSVISAATARSVGGPVVITGQELTFPAPTFTDTDLMLHLGELENGRIEATIEDLASGPTAQSTTWLEGVPIVDSEVRSDGARALKSIQLGQQATLVRRFDAQDTNELIELVDDPNPVYRGSDAALPPALLGGLISCLLGMTLPGPGTNWLKQRFQFIRPVDIDAEVEARVTVTRLRPDKELVNLASECEVGGEVVMTGESLVLVRDLQHD